MLNTDQTDCNGFDLRVELCACPSHTQGGVGAAGALSVHGSASLGAVAWTQLSAGAPSNTGVLTSKDPAG